jgi:four helix bundle protein
MLHIYPVVLDTIRRLRPTLAVIERKDRGLGRQLRRCSASVGLDLCEGMYSRGRNRAAKYHVALGSARQMLACLEVAEASATSSRLARPSAASSIASSARWCGWLSGVVEGQSGCPCICASASCIVHRASASGIGIGAGAFTCRLARAGMAQHWFTVSLRVLVPAFCHSRNAHKCE